VKTPRIKTGRSKSFQNEILLSQTNRITYSYTRDLQDQSITEVTNVSYEVLIGGIWETLVRYDSRHGNLHRHIRVRLQDEVDVMLVDETHWKGDHNSLLTAAINDIKKNYTEFRKRFLSRETYGRRPDEAKEVSAMRQAKHMPELTFCYCDKILSRITLEI